MAIPTEPIGSIPRPAELLSAMTSYEKGEIGDAELAAAQDEAIRDTIHRMEQTGSPVVTDGEQSKPSFATYPIAGFKQLAGDGVVIPFADGHQRQLPVLTGGPFRYQVHAAAYVTTALEYATVPVKQAVIAPSALSLLYPATDLHNYGREAFVADLVNEAEADIRGALEAGAQVVQLDFTEGRLSLKLDPSGSVLDNFIALNNQVLERFSDADRSRIGVHTCPGGDLDSTHSLDIDYSGLLPKLFQLKVGCPDIRRCHRPD
jgi:5-methyltetrahydropteroyltriglutamate--homocysteine methyltransferase